MLEADYFFNLQSTETKREKSNLKSLVTMCCFAAPLYGTVLQTHRPALLPADVGGVEVLDGQTLLLHVKAPQPLTRLVPTSTL